MSDSKKQILRGHINIIILKALLEGDKYGYEIGKYIEVKSEGDYKIKQPTLYSSLKRLEDRKIIESYWGDDSITHGGRRKYFKLTDYGKDICNDNVEKWNQSKTVIDKLISVKKDVITEKKPKIQTVINKPEINEELIPQLSKQPRTQQLFYIDNRQNEKDIEYRKILSKLLSNVKNDDEVEERPLFEKNTQTQPLEIESEKKENTFFQSSHTDNIKPQENQDININILQRDFNKPQKQIEFDDLPAKEDNQQQQPSSYSLLPSSSNKTAFGKLQQDLNEQGFILKPYTNLRKQSKQFLLINKINMITAFMLYLLIALHTALIYLLCETIIMIGMQYYIYALSIMLILPLSSLLGYAVKPNKKTKKVFYIRSLIIGSLLLFMLAVLCIISIALLFDIDLNSIKDITVKLIIPISYALHFVIYWIIWGILYKSKKYYAN